MSIVVQETDVKFTKIANVLITDQRLSSGAKVLYCYLRSKPTNWKVINSDIINTLQMSQESVAKYFKELISAGWIDRKKEQDEKGQLLGGFIYFLFDLPKKSIQEETPDTEKTQIREKPRHNNTNNINNTDLLSKTDSLLLATPKKFVKPTTEEIQTYCKEIGANINAEQFYDYYESKGWMIGKNKMKDWKAAVRTWKRNRAENETKSVANEFLELGRK